MTPEELAGCRDRLEDFAAEVFAPLVRSDQRAKGGLYLRGLLLDGRRKSMLPMARRLGVDHQGLQQFVTSSTWSVAAVQQRLARRAVAVVRPEAWVVDDTGFPKDGGHSPAAAAQYCPPLGKTANCQVAVSVHAATDRASCPLAWRLFVPESWDRPAAAERRRACRIPPEVHHRPKWTLALAMLDELAGLGLRPAVVAADAGYGNSAFFRRGLEERQLAYVLQVKGELTAYPADSEPVTLPYSGLGPRSLPRYRTRPVSLREHVRAAGRGQAVTVDWRRGSRGRMRARFVFVRVRPAGRRPEPADDGTIGLRWLIAQWPHDADEPVRYWLSNLPADLPPRVLVRLAKTRWRIEHDYRELKTALGLDHFEGRSWDGWHRHVTLVTAAHLFLTEQRTAPKAPAGA
ncbi:IS701 family transposase [Streptomyces longispororuber]|uniref:IS701 family transposase n=1 Tax=Streptomyces longispororuber TaxID=68230 RepID=UPI00210E3E53|nr:IS701 family transposase [Streptomyces longispororuber]MCQ4205537.1 IS701 family transposase [Streptomyces longispororuber]